MDAPRMFGMDCISRPMRSAHRFDARGAPLDLMARWLKRNEGRKTIDDPLQ